MRTRPLAYALSGAPQPFQRRAYAGLAVKTGGSSPATTPEIEMLWDDSVLLAWDDSVLLAWD